MLWWNREGDSTALFIIIAKWFTLFMIIKSTNGGNDLVALTHEQEEQLQPGHPFDANDDLNVNSDKKLSINSDISSHILSENELLRTSIRQNIIKNSTINNSLNINNNNNLNNLNNHNNVVNNSNVNNKVKTKKTSDDEFILNKDNSLNQLTNNENDNFTRMYFGTENLTTISTQVGSIAVIPCEVHHIGEGVVSWIRKKDYHLLTVGVTTYSSDERFSTIHSQDSEDWSLQIKYVQLRDAGIFECQVSTHPPTSIFIQLNVVEARAEIYGPPEKYLKPGSTLRLTCRVLQSTEPPLYIFWYHNNRMINYDLHRGVNVSTEADNRYSELVITQTSTVNSGNYSCVPNNAVAASTLVHILNGENPAAMQHGDHGNGILLSPLIHLLVTIVTYQAIVLC